MYTWMRRTNWANCQVMVKAKLQKVAMSLHDIVVSYNGNRGYCGYCGTYHTMKMNSSLWKWETWWDIWRQVEQSHWKIPCWYWPGSDPHYQTENKVIMDGKSVLHGTKRRVKEIESNSVHELMRMAKKVYIEWDDVKVMLWKMKKVNVISLGENNAWEKVKVNVISSGENHDWEKVNAYIVLHNNGG